jgi:hypothetical protein
MLSSQCHARRMLCIPKQCNSTLDFSEQKKEAKYREKFGFKNIFAEMLMTILFTEKFRENQIFRKNIRLTNIIIVWLSCSLCPA